MSRVRDRLYDLLPAVHRVRDAERGRPLETLVRVVETELDRIDDDIEELYENWFIETCDEWVVPYIGDLLGVRPIRSVESASVSARAYVANTLAYRRRKGTALVLEQLARDTTGWPARVVEFFTRLITTQHTNHVRRAPTATPDLRQPAVSELTDTAFDQFAHTADVGRIASGRGLHNIPNVGLFLWRLVSYPIGRGDPGDEGADFSTARQVAGPGGAYFTFHPVGLDAPLFNTPRTETTITEIAQEHHVPGQLRRSALQAELARIRQLVNTPPPRFLTEQDPVLRVLVQLTDAAPPVEIPREDLYVCEFPKAVAAASPPPPAAAIDPRRGRLVLPDGLSAKRVLVTYNYGFSGDLGGGPYDRTASVEAVGRASGDETDPQALGFFDPGVWQVGVSHLASGGGSGKLVPTLREAVAQWHAQSAGRTGVIVLMDSLTEHDAAGSPPGPLEIRIAEGSRLLIVAGTWPLEERPSSPPVPQRFAGRFRAQGVRPHFVGDLSVRGTAPATSSNPGSCFVNGLLLEGELSVANGHLGHLHLAHCTVVPPAGGVRVEGGNDRLRLELQRTICGPVHVPTPVRDVTLGGCILEGRDVSPGYALLAPGTECAIQGSTIFGAANVRSISASDSIFAAPVHATRRQTGCVRFSYVPSGSAVPRRFRCEPDTAVAEAVERARLEAAQDGTTLTDPEVQAISEAVRARIKPLFVSRRYGDPAYAQLEQMCAREIRTGAESGAEMGAFSFLEQPAREANLRGALDDYLRFGMEAGLRFVT